MVSLLYTLTSKHYIHLQNLSSVVDSFSYISAKPAKTDSFLAPESEAGAFHCPCLPSAATLVSWVSRIS
jgi:hypothetical protein